MRPSIEGDEITANNVHNEKALKYCNPSIIFPEHYFPESFIKEQVPASERDRFLQPNIIVDEMLQLLGYPVEKIDDYKVSVNLKNFKDKKVIYELLKLHPQVRYVP